MEFYAKVLQKRDYAHYNKFYCFFVGWCIAIKLSTFGAATLVADMRLKSHPLDYYCLDLNGIDGVSVTHPTRNTKP